jgi:gas vesicle protein
MIQPNPNTGNQGGMQPSSCPPGSSRMDTIPSVPATTTTSGTSIGTGQGSSGIPSQGTGGARETAQSAADQAKQKGRETVHRFKDQAATAGQQIKEQATQTAHQLKDKGESMAVQQKDRVADDIAGVGSAIRDAAHRLHDEEDHNLARYTEAIADQVERVSGYLRSRDLGGLIGDCENMARRRPELLLGGMFVTGLAIGRFLKASRRRRDRDFGRAEFYESDEFYAADDEYGEIEPVGTVSTRYGGSASQYGTWGDDRAPGAAAPSPSAWEGPTDVSDTSPAPLISTPDLDATSELPTTSSSEGSACDVPNKPR